MNFDMTHPNNAPVGGLAHQADNRSSEKKPFSRWKAAAIHLGLSIVIALGAIVLLYFFWYPQPFFEASGGQFLLMLLAAVDVVLGPMITLIIFNTKKKSLKFDLTVVALVQLAAICYGMYTMYLARPVFMVYSNSQFKVVTANEIEPEMLAQVTRAEFKSLSFVGPKYVFNNPPETALDLDALMLSGEALAPQFYVSYGERSVDAAKHGKAIAELLNRKPESKPFVEVVLKQKQRSTADMIYFPVIAKAMNMSALADARTGEILGVIPINPL